jgi:hypothetical protein
MGNQPPSPSKIVASSSSTSLPSKDEKQPVLIPPSFGVGPSYKLPLTLQAHDELQTAFFPVFYKHVQVSDPTYRILKDHMQPGLWLNSATSRSTVSASIVMNDAGNDVTTIMETESSKKGPGGRIIGERRLTDSFTAQIRGGTHQAPSVLTHWSVVPGFSLRAAANGLGQAWISSILSYSSQQQPSQSQPEFNLVGVTWLPLEFQKNGGSIQDAVQAVPHVTAFGALRVAGMTAAIESKVSTENLAMENQYYWSLNFLDDEREPPLQITLQKTPQQSTFALSQILTFDRYQFNPDEDRAALVRNTVGWTVQLLQQTNNSNNNDDCNTNSESTTTRATMGGAWQVNRALALKAVVQPQDNQLDLAVIFKRWQHPRVTCSLIARHDWSQGTTRLLGVGLELETGRATNTGESTYYQDSPEHTFSNKEAPKTRVV